MKKKILALLFCLLLTGCGENETVSNSSTVVSSSSTTTTTSKQLDDVDSTNITSETTTEDSNEALSDTASSSNTDIDNPLYEIFSLPGAVQNDTTGNWRITRTSDDIDITDYAIDYYNTFFSSNDEIHAIVNLALNTTTKISVLFDGVLDVTIYEYVEGEELDANILFGGTPLKEYWIYTESETIEEISSDTESLPVDDSTSKVTPEQTVTSEATLPEQATTSEATLPEQATTSEATLPEQATPQNEAPAPAEPAQTQVPESPNSSLVWVDDTAKRYHAKDGCGMDNAYQVTTEKAIAMGKTPCGRCYK